MRVSRLSTAASASQPGRAGCAIDPVNLDEQQSDRAENPAEADQSTAQADFDAATASPPGFRVLLLDDEPDNLALVQFLLEQEGLTVRAMSSPKTDRSAAGG
jgi:PleD family two-component response regulator